MAKHGVEFDNIFIRANKYDGASHFRILFLIMAPLTKATIAVLTLYYAVYHWNSWFHAMIFLRDRNLYPLQLILREILIQGDTTMMTAGSGEDIALNAYFCMERAIQKAKKNAVGITAISNTNHWMRPGAYGLMAAEKNCIGILWTNTLPNMPAWGGKDVKLGNNPVVICIPYEKGHVLIDIAMSMFSYGKLESYMRQGKDLPVDGGFDRDGNNGCSATICEN